MGTPWIIFILGLNNWLKSKPFEKLTMGAKAADGMLKLS